MVVRAIMVWLYHIGGSGIGYAVSVMPHRILNDWYMALVNDIDDTSVGGVPTLRVTNVVSSSK